MDSVPSTGSRLLIPKRYQAGETMGDLIYWLYTDVMRRPDLLDASVYGRETKLLKPFVRPKRGQRKYTCKQIAELIFYLVVKGVDVDGFRVLHYPELLRTFVDGELDETDRIIASILMGKEKGEFDPPRGWSGCKGVGRAG